jgi:hypothetical protein
MALSATVVFEIQPAGANANDANGGGFNSAAGGTDYTQGAGLTHFDITDLETDGATLTVMCSVGRNFVAADVGNLIHIVTSDGGSHAYTERFQIISVAGGKATVDRAWSAADNSDHNDAVAILGGALATIGGLGAIFAQTTTVASAQAVAGMRAYMLHGTYTLSNVAANVSGGPLDLDTSSMDGKGFYLKGYDDAYGRDSFSGTRPLIDCDVITPTIAKVILLKGDFGSKKEQVVAFLEVDGQGLLTSGIAGWHSAYASAVSCYVHDCDLSTGFGFIGLKAVQCRASGCAGSGFYGCNSFSCLADNNGAKGFDSGSAQWYVNCVAYKNGGRGFQSFSTVVIGCLAYDNGSDGFCDDSSNVYVNCVGYLNDAYEFQTIGGDILINCATRVGASGRTYGTPNCDVGPITLTADPFINAAALDFSLNNTAGGGALLRAAGISPYGQTGFIDIGAVQHAYPPAAEVLTTCDEMTGTYVAAADANVRYGVANGVSPGAGTLIVPGTASNSLAVARETSAKARGGSGTCAKLTPASVSAAGYWDFYVPATGTGAHTVDFWWAKEAVDDTMTLKVSVFDIDSGAALLTDEVVDISAASTDWTHKTDLTHVHPAAAGLIRVRMTLQCKTSTGNILYVDDVTIT